MAYPYFSLIFIIIFLMSYTSSFKDLKFLFTETSSNYFYLCYSLINSYSSAYYLSFNLRSSNFFFSSSVYTLSPPYTLPPWLILDSMSVIKELHPLPIFIFYMKDYFLSRDKVSNFSGGMLFPPSFYYVSNIFFNFLISSEYYLNKASFGSSLIFGLFLICLALSA